MSPAASVSRRSQHILSRVAAISLAVAALHLVDGQAPQAGAVAGGVPAATPEFEFATPRDATVIQAVRRRHGLASVPPLRLEGTLSWRGSAQVDRWGISLDWPAAYQQRNAERVHTLIAGRYWTNGDVPAAVQEVARENVTARLAVLSVLVLARPHEPGIRLAAAGTRVVDGHTLRVYTVSNSSGPFVSMLVSTDDRIAGVSQPWTAEPGETAERLERVRSYQQVADVTVPRVIELRVGKHLGEITVVATTGEVVRRDFQ